MKRLVIVAALVSASVPFAARAQEPVQPLPPTTSPVAPEPPPPEVAPAPPPPAAAHPAPVVVVANDDRRAPLAAESVGPRAEGAPRYDFLRVGAGVRIGYVDDRAFDTFSSNDVLPQFSLEGTAALLVRGRLALAAGLAWDVGGRGNGLRGLDAALTAHRFSVPIEARYHATPWLYGFARVAPGAALLFARVDDPSSPAKLKDSAWAFTTDLSAGASFLLGPRADLDKRGAVRFWVTPEIGYAVASAAKLRPEAARAEGDVLGADAAANLGSLGLTGLFWRASVGATF